MLPRRFRLPRSLFQGIFSSGRPYHGRFVVLRVKKNEQALLGAVVVSKKVAGKASARNLLKRRLRSLFAEAAKDGAVPPGEYVLIAKKGAEAASFSELRDDLGTLFRSV